MNIIWITVILNIIVSAITAYVIVIINLKILSRKLNKFQEDIIDVCTTKIEQFIKKLF